MSHLELTTIANTLIPSLLVNLKQAMLQPIWKATLYRNSFLLQVHSALILIISQLTTHTPTWPIRRSLLPIIFKSSLKPISIGIAYSASTPALILLPISLIKRSISICILTCAMLLVQRKLALVQISWAVLYTAPSLNIPIFEFSNIAKRLSYDLPLAV